MSASRSTGVVVGVGASTPLGGVAALRIAIVWAPPKRPLPAPTAKPPAPLPTPLRPKPRVASAFIAGFGAFARRDAGSVPRPFLFSSGASARGGGGAAGAGADSSTACRWSWSRASLRSIAALAAGPETCVGSCAALRPRCARQLAISDNATNPTIDLRKGQNSAPTPNINHGSHMNLQKIELCDYRRQATPKVLKNLQGRFWRGCCVAGRRSGARPCCRISLREVRRNIRDEPAQKARRRVVDEQKMAIRWPHEAGSSDVIQEAV